MTDDAAQKRVWFRAPRGLRVFGGLQTQDEEMVGSPGFEPGVSSARGLFFEELKPRPDWPHSELAFGDGLADDPSSTPPTNLVYILYSLSGA